MEKRKYRHQAASILQFYILHKNVSNKSTTLFKHLLARWLVQKVKTDKVYDEVWNGMECRLTYLVLISTCSCGRGQNTEDGFRMKASPYNAVCYLVNATPSSLQTEFFTIRNVSLVMRVLKIIQNSAMEMFWSELSTISGKKKVYEKWFQPHSTTDRRNWS
jgi:hypothetical protein